MKAVVVQGVVLVMHDDVSSFDAACTVNPGVLPGEYEVMEVRFVSREDVQEISYEE